MRGVGPHDVITGTVMVYVLIFCLIKLPWALGVPVKVPVGGIRDGTRLLSSLLPLVVVVGVWSFCGGVGKCVLCTEISLWACNCLSAFVLLDPHALA